LVTKPPSSEGLADVPGKSAGPKHSSDWSKCSCVDRSSGGWRPPHAHNSLELRPLVTITMADHRRPCPGTHRRHRSGSHCLRSGATQSASLPSSSEPEAALPGLVPHADLLRGVSSEPVHGPDSRGPDSRPSPAAEARPRAANTLSLTCGARKQSSSVEGGVVDPAETCLRALYGKCTGSA
jgi:hypothetical protein